MKPGFVGILGGLGPDASADFYAMVNAWTDAKRDQDHLNLMLMSHATIPDRTAFILGKSKNSPVPDLVEDAKTLEAMGASFLVMPCNTAHTFYEAVEMAVHIPLLNIIQETVQEVKRRFPDAQKIGLLATDGTLRSGTYQRECERQGLECVCPDATHQRAVMTLIYDVIKAGQKMEPAMLEALLDALRAQGCSSIVLGCTELSVARRRLALTDPDVVDSMEVLARQTVLRAGKRLAK